jgi:hypothetical protein
LEEYSEESLAMLPPQVAQGFDKWLDLYTDSPYLNGMTCVALATGVAKTALKGKYLDVGQDLGDIIAQKAALQNSEMYSLHTTFLGSLLNDGGPADRPKVEPFVFPGF